MKFSRIFLVIPVLLVIASCNTTYVTAKASKDLHFYDRSFNASPNECYYAIRWALKINGYPVAKENLADGILTTTWEPVKADSHYLPFFERKDYGVSGAYHQLEVRVVPRGGTTLIEVGSRVKSVVSNLKSSGVEERKVLAEVGDYLRSREPNITNEGIAE